MSTKSKKKATGESSKDESIRKPSKMLPLKGKAPKKINRIDNDDDDFDDDFASDDYGDIDIHNDDFLDDDDDR